MAKKRDPKESAAWWLSKSREHQTAKGRRRVSPAKAEVLADRVERRIGGPVRLSYWPTATSNPADPRTAAAGYDLQTQTLRVEWGDGGPAYNYYNVPPRVWEEFQRTSSPGKYINRVLNYYEYGPADHNN